MGKQKLTPRLVNNIIKMLLSGKYTHKQIADKVNQSFAANRQNKTISREIVTKINIGLQNPKNIHARWLDITQDYGKGE